MRTESFHADDLAKALRRTKIATMPELKRALGTEVDVTVFRKLKQLAYRTSYSHRGSYYTLDETAHFDQNGLWSFPSVWFSRQGTLLDTAQALVENSSAGHFAEELDHLLHVGTKEPLLRLVQHERVAREPVEGLYLYCSMNLVLRKRQLLARHVLQAEPNLASSLAKAEEVVSDELKAAMVLFSSMLNEKQRRLYAGLESLKPRLRRGSADCRVHRHGPSHGGPGSAPTAGTRPGNRPHPQSRRRAQAAGKKTPEVIARIEELMQHDTAGDPITGVKWSRRTTRKIAEELTALGIAVSKNTVGRLLKELKFKLRVNRKQIASTQNPDRNPQFPLHRAATRTICQPRPAQHQCRYEEEGTNWQLQKRRRQVGSRTGPGKGS